MWKGRCEKMKRFLVYVLCSTSFLMFLPQNLEAGTWYGSNLIQNGSFEEDFSYWGGTQTGIWRIVQYSNSTNHYAYNSYSAQLYQSVTIEEGKRYRLYGRSVCAGGSSYMIDSTEIWQTDSWVDTPRKMSAKSVLGIASQSGTTSIHLIYSKGTGTSGGFDNISFQQVIYDPQLDILESDLTITEDMLNGSSATVELTLNDLSYADTPTDWYIDWGDGIIDYNPVLNTTHQHIYDVSTGAQVFTATLYGINQAGEFSESIQIGIVPEPATFSLFVLAGLFLYRKRLV